MTELNVHSKYIDKRINDITKNNKWNSKFIDTSHEDFIKDYASNVFTNLVLKEGCGDNVWNRS